MFAKAMQAIAKREARKYAERETEKAAHKHPMLGKVTVGDMKFQL